MMTPFGAGLRLGFGRSTRRATEGGSFSSALFTFSLLVLVMAIGFLFGRMVIARAYAKGPTLRPPKGTAVEPLHGGATAVPRTGTNVAPPMDTATPPDQTNAPTEGDTTPPPSGDQATEAPNGNQTNAVQETPRDVRYAVQVGAFAGETSARQAQVKLTKAGYRARIVRVDDPHLSFKVMTGRYQDETDARDALDAIQKAGFPGAFVTEER